MGERLKVFLYLVHLSKFKDLTNELEQEHVCDLTRVQCPCRAS